MICMSNSLGCALFGLLVMSYQDVSSCLRLLRTPNLSSGLPNDFSSLLMSPNVSCLLMSPEDSSCLLVSSNVSQCLLMIAHVS